MEKPCDDNHRLRAAVSRHREEVRAAAPVRHRVRLPADESVILRRSRRKRAVSSGAVGGVSGRGKPLLSQLRPHYEQRRSAGLLLYRRQGRYIPVADLPRRRRNDRFRPAACKSQKSAAWRGGAAGRVPRVLRSGAARLHGA